MSFQDFCESLAAGGSSPAQLSPALKALWQDGRGNWDQAHTLAQSDAGPDGAWVHAYLHRKEGDAGNAAYWYRRAGRPVPTSVTLEAEWKEIAQTLLAGGGAMANGRVG